MSDFDDDECDWINEECAEYPDSDADSDQSEKQHAIARVDTPCVSQAFLQPRGEFELLAHKLLNRTTSMPFYEQFAPINEMPACMMPLLSAAPGSKYVVHGETGCGKTTFTTLAMLHAKKKAFALSAFSLDTTTCRDLTDSVARKDWTCIIDDVDDIPVCTAKLLTKCLQNANSTLIFICHTLSKQCKTLSSVTKNCTYIHLRRSKTELQLALKQCGCSTHDAMQLSRTYDQDFRSAMIAAQFTVAEKGISRLSMAQEINKWMSTSTNCKFATVEDKKHLFSSVLNVRNNSNALHSALLASDRDVSMCNMATETYLCSVRS